MQWAAQVRGWATILLPISIRFETNRAEVVLPALAAQLAQLFDEELPPAPFDALAFYRDRVTQYLARLDGIDRRCLIVLDGIDEAADWRVDATLLPAQPPPGLRIAVSARLTADASTVGAWRTRLGWDPLSAQVRTIDLALLQASAVRVLVDQLVPRLGLHGDESAVDALAQRLAQLSNGDPLLLSLNAEDIAEGTERDLARITRGLSGRTPGLRAYFDDWLYRSGEAAAGGGLAREAAEAALLVLACALGPMRHDELSAVLERLDLPHAILPGRSALTRAVARFVIGDGDRDGYVLGHPRFAEHLRESQFSGSRVGQTVAALEYWCFDAVRDGAPSPYVLVHAAQHLERSGGKPALRAERAALLLQPRWRESRLGESLGEVAYAADLRSALAALQSAILAVPEVPPPEWLADAMHAALVSSSLRSAGRNLSDRILAAAVRHGVVDAKAALALARQGDTGARVSTWLELMPYLAADVVEQLWDEIAALFPRLRSMSLIGHAWQIADRLPVRHLPALLEQAGDLLITNVVDHVLRVSTERLGTEAPAALQRFVDEASVQSNVALAHAHLARISQGSDRDYYRARAEAVRRFDAPLTTMPVDAVLLEFVEGAAAQTTVDDWLTQARANGDSDVAVRQFAGFQYRIPRDSALRLREGLRTWLDEDGDDAPARLESLARLAGGSDDTSFVAAVYARIAGIQDTGARHSALTWIASRLGTAEIEEAVKLARGTGSAAQRAELLTTLLSRAPQPARAGMFDEVLALMLGPEVPQGERVWLLGRLRSAAGEDTQGQDFDALRIEAARQVDDDRLRAEHLAELALRHDAPLGAKLAVEALHAARRIEDDATLWVEKLRLARQVGAPRRADLVRDAVADLDALPPERAFDVLVMAGKQDLLPAEVRAQWAELARRRVDAERSPYSIVELCDAYRSELAHSVHAESIAILDEQARLYAAKASGDDAQLVELGASIGDQTDPAPWAFHLEWMSFRQRPRCQRALGLGRLLRRARALRSPADRASALQLFPRFHRWRCRHVLKEALAAARQARRGDADGALLSIAELLPPHESVALYQELLAAAAAPSSQARQMPASGSASVSGTATGTMPGPELPPAQSADQYRRQFLLGALARRVPESMLDQIERAASSLPDAASRFEVLAAIALRRPSPGFTALIEPWLEPSLAAEVEWPLLNRAVELIERADGALKRRLFCTVVALTATMRRNEAVGPLAKLVDGLPPEARDPCAARLLSAIEDVERIWP